VTTDRRLPAGALALALFVAACSGSTSTPAASATPGGGTGAPTAAPTEPPAPTDEPTGTDDNGSEPSFGPGQAADLEASLPDSAGGVEFTKGSFDGAAIAGSGFVNTGDLDPILTANGKTLADVRMAIATPKDPTSAMGMVVLALQVRGLDASQLLEFGGAGTGTDLEAVTIAGKQVQRGGEGGFGVYVYVKDDVLYEILFASDAVAEEILGQLP
jgi:hypothetical protein